MDEYLAHVRLLQEIDYYNTNPKAKSVSNSQGMNFTTNYSANAQPIASGSYQGEKQSESIINVAVGESAFVNSNVGITIDKHWNL